MIMSMLSTPATTQIGESNTTLRPRIIAWQMTLMMLVLLPASLLLLQTDPRLLNGISVWVKPIKFEISLALHFATLAVLVNLVAPVPRSGRFLRNAFSLSGIAALYEIGYIALQAARGRASHFNDGTALESALYQVMGVGAVVLVVVAFLLGALILKAPRPQLGPGLRLGAGLGLTMGGVATLLTAGIMGSGAIPEALGLPPGHWIGGDLSDAGGLPLLGWSTTGGDLRVPHFFATHVMQVLPAVGWATDRFLPRRARRIVLGVSAGLLAVILGTFIQAALGIPFIRL
nr:hypothetical protein [uncultured Dongia sp.]